jgi:hypothetical protein
MNSLDRNIITSDHYNLGTKDGVCVFVHNSISYSNINLNKFCIDQIIDIYAVKLLSFG